MKLIYISVGMRFCGLGDYGFEICALPKLCCKINRLSLNWMCFGGSWITGARIKPIREYIGYIKFECPNLTDLWWGLFWTALTNAWPSRGIDRLFKFLSHRLTMVISVIAWSMGSPYQKNGSILDQRICKNCNATLRGKSLSKFWCG